MSSSSRRGRAIERASARAHLEGVDDPREVGEREREETRRLWIPVDACELTVGGERKKSVSKVEKNGRAAHDPEVLAKPARRRYTADYKRKILEEADACAAAGEIGALLRREGLYSSLLTSWRRQRDDGALAGLEPKKRGRKAKRRDPIAMENERLRREVERLEHRLMQAEVIIGVQKKLANALGIQLPTDDENGRNE